MRVTFNDVLDRAYTTLITDYELDSLIKMDEQAFYDFLGGFLVNSIDMFDGCLTDLSYHIESSVDDDGCPIDIYVFDNDLTSKEIYILTLGVAICWYRKALDDKTQFALHLQTKEFKSFSEQQNIQRRQDRLDRMVESLSREINDYQLSNLSKLPFWGCN